MVLLALKENILAEEGLLLRVKQPPWLLQQGRPFPVGEGAAQGATGEREGGQQTAEPGRQGTGSVCSLGSQPAVCPAVTLLGVNRFDGSSVTCHGYGRCKQSLLQTTCFSHQHIESARRLAWRLSVLCSACLHMGANDARYLGPKS